MNFVSKPRFDEIATNQRSRYRQKLSKRVQIEEVGRVPKIELRDHFPLVHRLPVERPFHAALSFSINSSKHFQHSPLLCSGLSWNL
jgi:hypothetical protein